MNTNHEVMPETKKQRIRDSLDELPLDVLVAIYKIVLCAESGME